MSESETRISNPDEAGKKTVTSGRIWVGDEYNGEDVQFAMKVLENNDED